MKTLSNRRLNVQFLSSTSSNWTRWFPQLAEMGLQPGDLWNPCTNIHVGAWILAGEICRFGYTWQAIGAYHAGPALTVAREQRRRKYAQRVYHNLAVIDCTRGEGLLLDDRFRDNEKINYFL